MTVTRLRKRAPWMAAALGSMTSVLGCSQTAEHSPTAAKMAVSASPKLSEERDVEIPVPVLRMTPNYVNVSAGNNSYLLVWSTGSVYAARVGYNGQLLDPMPIFLGGTGAGTPRVSFNGQEWLVAWQDQRNGNYDVYGTRVTPSGQVLDPDGVAIAAGTLGELFLDVTSDGTRFLALYYVSKNIVGTFVNADGSLDSAQVSVGAGTDARVAYNGSDFLVFYNNYTNNSVLRTTRVTPSGLVDAAPKTVATVAGHPTSDNMAVGSGGGQWLIAYSVGSSLYDCAVKNDGALVASPAIVSNEYGAERLAFGYSGNLFTLMFRNNSLVSSTHPGGMAYTMRLSAGGVLQNQQALLDGSTWGVNDSAWAFDGTNYLLAFVGSPITLTNPVVRATRIAPDLSLVDSDPVGVSYIGNTQKTADTAFNGSNYLVAWEDDRALSSGVDIRASLVTPDGVVRTPNGFLISGAVAEQSRVTLASNGEGYLAVWNDFRASSSPEIMMTGIAADGALVHSGGVKLTAGNSTARPALASLGGKYLLVSPGMMGMIIEPTPTPAVTNTSPAQLASLGSNPALATNGTNYLLAYKSLDDIYGVLLDAAGVRQSNENGIVISATANRIEDRVSVASNGSDYLAVWLDSGIDIRGTRLAGSGQVRDTLGFNVYNGNYAAKSSLQVVWDGSSYVVTWTDEGNSGADAQGVYACTVDVSGTTPVVSGRLTISATSSTEGIPRIAAGNVSATSKQSLIVYDRYDGSPNAYIGRVKGRFLSDDTISIPPLPKGGASSTGGTSALTGAGGSNSGGTASSGSGGTTSAPGGASGVTTGGNSASNSGGSAGATSSNTLVSGGTTSGPVSGGTSSVVGGATSAPVGGATSNLFGGASSTALGGSTNLNAGGQTNAIGGGTGPSEIGGTYGVATGGVTPQDQGGSTGSVAGATSVNSTGGVGTSTTGSTTLAGGKPTSGGSTSNSSTMSNGAVVCVPGDQKECACPGGVTSSVQICEDSGTKYAACQCAQTTPKSNDDGCGCRMPGHSKAHTTPLLAAWVTALSLYGVAARKRRRSRDIELSK